MKYSVSNWHHSRPKKYFPRCIELFGEPTFAANVRHGYALWKTKGLFTQHLLIDEDVKHCVPRPHHDYFYSSVKFFVPKDKVCDVLKISGSLNYDGLKKELTARCGGIGANYATIYLGMLVANGTISIRKAQSNDMYARMIRGEILPHKDMAKKMMALKRENNKKFRKELGLEYATYAFNACYKPKKKTHKKQRGGYQIKTLRRERKRIHMISPKLINTRGEKCTSRNNTACCPHMRPDEKGRYRATNEMTPLHYRGKKYQLHTCCLMCSQAMNHLAKTNIEKFDKNHRPIIMKDGSLKLANAVTGKYIQILPLIE